MITKKYFKMIRVSYADSEYFRITNLSNETGKFSITKQNSPQFTLDYSVGDTSSWTSYNVSTMPNVDVPSGSSIYLRGVITTGNAYSYYYMHFNKSYSIGGNVMSIVDKNNFTTMTSTETNKSILYLFKNETNLLSAEDMNFGNVNTFGEVFFRDFFNGCSNLAKGPDFSNITSLGLASMMECFVNCTSLVSGPNLTNVTNVTSSSLDYLCSGCTSLTTAYAPNLSTWTGTDNWLREVAASGTLYCPSQAVADLIPNDSASGCPSNWTKVAL